MRTSTILTFAFAAFSTVLALPSGANDGYCLCEADANAVANNVQLLFANYTNAFAREILTPNFKDQTDSVQFLMNNGTNCPKPLGTVTFTNRTSLIAAQGGQGSIPWENLNVFWDCKSVFIRWVSKQSPFHVQGISIFHTAPNPKPTKRVPHLIDHVFSEFNSGAWLVNRGVYQGVGFLPGCEGVVGPVGNSGL